VRRDQLEHAIRTACQIAGITEVIIVGSQAILGTFTEDELPFYALRFPREGPEPITLYYKYIRGHQAWVATSPDPADCRAVKTVSGVASGGCLLRAVKVLACRTETSNL
jgi:hypothetical protein